MATMQKSLIGIEKSFMGKVEQFDNEQLNVTVRVESYEGSQDTVVLLHDSKGALLLDEVYMADVATLNESIRYARKLHNEITLWLEVNETKHVTLKKDIETVEMPS